MLADLLGARRCPGCAAVGRVPCDRCTAALDGCVLAATAAGDLVVRAAAGYEGPVRALLVAHKERGRLDLTSALGSALARAAAPFRPDVLIPVAAASRARRSRGYDHALLLARSAGTWPVVPVLRRVRAVRDQVGLDLAGRLANVHGADGCDPAVAARLVGLRLVVVDDVVTTGATTAEAVRALRAVGLRPVGVAAVACSRIRSPREGCRD